MRATGSSNATASVRQEQPAGEQRDYTGQSRSSRSTGVSYFFRQLKARVKSAFQSDGVGTVPDVTSGGGRAGFRMSPQGMRTGGGNAAAAGQRPMQRPAATVADQRPPLPPRTFRVSSQIPPKRPALPPRRDPRATKPWVDDLGHYAGAHVPVPKQRPVPMRGISATQPWLDNEGNYAPAHVPVPASEQMPFLSAKEPWLHGGGSYGPEILPHEPPAGIPNPMDEAAPTQGKDGRSEKMKDPTRLTRKDAMRYARSLKGKEDQLKGKEWREIMGLKSTVSLKDIGNEANTQADIDKWQEYLNGLAKDVALAHTMLKALYHPDMHVRKNTEEREKMEDTDALISTAYNDAEKEIEEAINALKLKQNLLKLLGSLNSAKSGADAG